MLRVHRAVPSGRLGEMTRRKREITGLANERDFRIWSNSQFRREAFAVFSQRSIRSTVTGASQSAAAGVGTRQNNPIFDSASPTLPLRMHSAIASVASA